MAEGNDQDGGDHNIARRTRSNLRIENFVPNDNLDFPDVDMNLYQNPDSEGDTEYKRFLNQMYSEDIGTETNTDDNDPEYVYNDDIFSHGWRFNLDEVSELQPDKADLNQDDRVDIFCNNNVGGQQAVDQPGTSSGCVFKSPSKFARRRVDMFEEPEFARVLNQQLRQHIQLLTQTYLLTKNTTNMRNEAEEAKTHLNSYMKIFKNKSKPSNLLPALDIINNLITPRDIKSSIRLSWRPLPIPDLVKKTIAQNPNVFIYPSLLPQVAFSILPERLIPKKPKINFTLNEDKLLAYALNEFKSESSPHAFIASLLMTAKTKTQISNHIKNIKRSPGNENNPIKLYFADGELPAIDLDSDSQLGEISLEVPQQPDIEMKTELKQEPKTENEPESDHGQELEQRQKEPEIELNIDNKTDTDYNENQQALHELEESESRIFSGFDATNDFCHQQDDIMNMDLDDLMAASTTISKSTMMNVNSSENKNLKNIKLKKSMLHLMSHDFSLSKDMDDLIIYDFLKVSQETLSERNHLHLLQLFTDLMRKELKKDDDDRTVKIYREILKYFEKIDAPKELSDRLTLFLDLDQATKCDCAMNYLHWMRFFSFMQHIQLYHDGGEVFEKKLSRLIDALQREDPHKIKLAIGNLINKHPFLKREFDSLSLDGKPHPSLFNCEEDFDDITEPIALLDTSTDKLSKLEYEHFNSKVSKEELSYASQTCPCKCHTESTIDGQHSQHCGECNLKFMKGRMYLVNKIKPILAEWSYTGREETPTTRISSCTAVNRWTLEEDREILEFCREKAEQNEETISFDTSTFEELIAKRQNHNGGPCSTSKKNAKEIAERFNQLMEMYKDENSNAVQ